MEFTETENIADGAMVDLDTTTMKEILSNRYELVRTIGSGGSGIVIEVRDRILDKSFAIKKLHKLSSETESRRFQREAKLAGSLNHPNVVSVIDFGIACGQEPYMVLEYVDGANLSAFIRTRETLSIKDALRIFIQIADGLAHAHSRAVIHRDVKPSNVLLVKNDNQVTVKLIDFGLAKSITTDQNLTVQGLGIGTPDFMSPEQVKSLDVDSRTDIYSFGCLMYQVLTGNRVFPCDTTVDTIFSHLNSTPASMNLDVPPEVSHALNNIVLKSLSKLPSDRQQDIVEVKKELESVSLMLDRSVEDVIRDCSPSPEPSSVRLNFAIIACAVFTTILVVFFSWKVLTDDVPLGSSSSFEETPRFHEIAGFYYLEAKASIGDLAHLMTTEHVQSLAIDGTKLRLSEITPLLQDKVKTLRFRDHQIDHAFLSSIAEIRGLECLDIGETEHLDESSFSELQNLPFLSALSIREVKVTNNLLVEISKLRRLRHLKFENCVGLDSVDFRVLRNLQHLEHLALIATDVTDAGIGQIAELPKLSIINLKLSKITDAGLEKLLKLKSLKVLYLRGASQLTEPAIERLQERGVLIESRP